MDDRDRCPSAVIAGSMEMMFYYFFTPSEMPRYLYSEKAAATRGNNVLYVVMQIFI